MSQSSIEGAPLRYINKIDDLVKTCVQSKPIRAKCYQQCYEKPYGMKKGLYYNDVGKCQKDCYVCNGVLLLFIENNCFHMKKGGGVPDPRFCKWAEKWGLKPVAAQFYKNKWVIEALKKTPSI